MNPRPEHLTPRPLPERVALSCLIAVLTSVSPGPAVRAADTLYVNQNSQCPGNGSWNSPFCTIATALAPPRSGGPDTVLAVMPGIYHEEVMFAAKDSGLVSHPFVFLARGTVILQGADLCTPTPCINSRPAAPGSALQLKAIYVGSDSIGTLVDTTQNIYPQHDESPSIDDLPAIGAGTYLRIPGQDTAYVNFGGVGSNSPVYVSKRRPIRVRASNITISGFIITNSLNDGIAIGDAPPAIRNVTIDNCTVSRSTNQGIDVRRSSWGSIQHNTVHSNGNHGIYLISDSVAFYKVVGNVSSYNATPDTAREANGIRIGNEDYTDDPMVAGVDTSTIGLHVVDRNTVHHNEDSGIEIHGSHGATLRNNRSYLNGDHGFDHLSSRSTAHSGNLAYRNHTDGISVESGSTGTRLHNCIMVDNGQGTTNYDPELETAPGARWGFAADNNLYYRPPRSGVDAGDVVLVDFEGGNQFWDSFCGDTALCFNSRAQLRLHFPQYEAHGKENDPRFGDAPGGDFGLKTDSPAVDAADTTVVGWSPTDAVGFRRYDCRLIGNAGTPSGAFGDIGPLEHDDGAPVIEAIVDYNTADIAWVARGATGDALPAPVRHEVYVNDVKKIENEAPVPGSSVVETVTLSLCATSSVHVVTVDSDGLMAKSNTLALQTCCGQGCYGMGPGGDRSHAGREEGEYRLELSPPQPNPVAGKVVVGWSIPRAMAGEALELALFDVAGRRIMTITRGPAEPGRFVREVSLRQTGREGAANGVLFLRLRAGNKTMDRTLVVVH